MTKRVLMALAVVCGSVLGARAACVDHKAFDKILRANVDGDGYVNYDAIRVNKGGDLHQYLSFLEVADLSSCTEDEKLVFWINTYNANAIEKILARPNMKKVSEDLKLFNERFKVAKIQISLSEIENRVLRISEKDGGPIPGYSLKAFEPRIHFCLVCCAVDCPKLLNRAYSTKNLADVLQANAVNFANSPKHLRIENGKLVVSSILKWYGQDFEKLGGVVAYFSSLTDVKLRPDADDIDAKLKADFPSNVSYAYDWTVNSVQNKPAASAAK